MARLAFACFFLMAPAQAQMDDVSLIQLTSAGDEVDHCSASDAKLLEQYDKQFKSKFASSSKPRALNVGAPQHAHMLSLLQNDQMPIIDECMPEKVYTSEGKIKEKNMHACFLASGNTKGSAQCLTDDSMWREKHCASKCKESFFSPDCMSCPQDHAEELIVCQTVSNGVSEKCGHCFAHSELWQAKHCAEPCTNYQFTGEGMEKCEKCNQEAADKTLNCQGKSLTMPEIMEWNLNAKKYDAEMKVQRKKMMEEQERQERENK